MNNPSVLKTASCVALGSLLWLGACSGGAAGDRANRGDFKVNLITSGLGQMFPYRIRELDSFGNPSAKVLNIETIDTLKNNTNANNGVLPVASFQTTATLPSGAPGNQYILLRFSHKVLLSSILSDQLANQTNSGLTTAVSLLTYNPATESTSVIKGRGFINGMTYFNRNGQLELVEAVEVDSNGNVTVKDAEANGFPLGFTGDEDLVQPNSFVFIPDADDDLSTFETFPTTDLLRIIVTNAVRDTDGKVLELEVCTATTVGADPNPPDVLGFSPNQTLQITPGNADTDVDPTTTILVRFNKPVQPADVGTFFDSSNLVPPSGGVTIGVTLGTNSFNVIYYSDPLGVGDFCNYTVKPAYNLPGKSAINLAVNNVSVRGLSNQTLGNTVNTTFNTGDGPGIVNAPVSPEALYIGIAGDEPGISVIDLNGFGQGTGDLADTNFPNNPNLRSSGLTPPMAPGTSNVDAGGRGPLTLVQDTNLNTRLLRDPIVGNVTDIHIGNPLDLIFNNENINRNTTKANQQNPLGTAPVGGNTITAPPVPNPPKLVFPPPNPARAIFAEEPTQVGPLNLLVNGNPFSKKIGELGIFGVHPAMRGVFVGPAPPPASPPPPPASIPFTVRQQVGHFLYVLDQDNRQVLVVNSNRMTVLDTLRFPDPIDLAMSPNLRLLAVSNSSGTISFVDINPLSINFHQIVGESRTDPGATKVVWQPDGEALGIISRSRNSLTIVRALDFSVEKTVTGFLNEPIDLVFTPRYQTTGNTSGVYYGYILNSNGQIAIFESGPDGVNGIGFNNIIGIVSGVTFRRGRKMVMDPLSNFGALLIAHVEENGLGAVTRLELTSSPQGQQPISQNQGGFIVPPTFRQKEWTPVQRFGGLNPTTPSKDLFSGNAPVDIALDDMFNNGGLLNQATPFNQTLGLEVALHSGKSLVKTGGIVAYNPILMFVALADTGKVDVFELGTGKRLRTIDVPGVTVLSNYWRQ